MQLKVYHKCVLKVWIVIQYDDVCMCVQNVYSHIQDYY